MVKISSVSGRPDHYIFYIFYTVFKRWKAYAIFFLTCLVLVGSYVWFTPWSYESDAQIIIKAGDQDIAETNSNLSPEGAQPTSSEIIRRIVNTHLGVIHSQDVIRETLNRLGIAAVYPDIVASPPRFFGTPLDAAIARLNADLTVTAPPNSNLLQVSVINRTPAMAQTVLNTLMAVFMEKDVEVMRDPRTHLLIQQVTAARAKVDDIQHATFTYKKDNDISSLDDERSLLLRQRDLLEQNLANENSQSLHLSLTAAQTALATAEQRYLMFSQSYVEDNPVRQRALVALNLARQQYKTLLTSIASSQGGVSLTATWEKRLITINDRLSQLNQAEGKLLDLRRQIDIATQTYMAFAQRLANANFTTALNQHGSPNIAVSQEPTLSNIPARPRIRLMAMLAVVFGLLGGLGLCFMLEAVDETIGLPDEVEPLLGLPVLATLDYNRMIKALTPRMRKIEGMRQIESN